MPTSDNQTHARYEVKVRGTKFLWGSAGINVNTNFDKPLLLHIRNDIFGETVTIGTQVAGGMQTTLGTLEPGECLSVPIQGIAGVYATCSIESDVGCLIHPST